MNKLELEKKIQIIIREVTDHNGYVCASEVLIHLGYLSLKDYENWRKGKIEYLEKVCTVNLGILSTIVRLINKVSEKMKLEPSLTVYNKYGKGPRIRLRFSKSGDINIEKAYSTHHVNKYRINQLKELKRQTVELIDGNKINHQQVTCL
jgi:hypothetical protein